MSKDDEHDGPTLDPQALAGVSDLLEGCEEEVFAYDALRGGLRKAVDAGYDEHHFPCLGTCAAAADLLYYTAMRLIRRARESRGVEAEQAAREALRGLLELVTTDILNTSLTPFAPGPVDPQ